MRRPTWFRRWGPALSVLIGVVLVGQALFYASDLFYLSDTWPIVVGSGFGVFLIVLGSIQVTTASLSRQVIDVPIPRDQLWLRLIDPIIAGRTWPFITSTEVLEKDQDGSAARWLSRFRRGAYEGTLECQVTSKVPVSFYGYRTTGGGHVEYTLDEIPNGTRVTRTEMLRTSLLIRWLRPLGTLQFQRNVRNHLRLLAATQTPGGITDG